MIKLEELPWLLLSKGRAEEEEEEEERGRGSWSSSMKALEDVTGGGISSDSVEEAEEEEGEEEGRGMTKASRGDGGSRGEGGTERSEEGRSRKSSL